MATYKKVEFDNAQSMFFSIALNKGWLPSPINKELVSESKISDDISSYYFEGMYYNNIVNAISNGNLEGKYNPNGWNNLKQAILNASEVQGTSTNDIFVVSSALHGNPNAGIPNTPFLKSKLNGQQLAMLYIAFSSGLFGKPTTAEILYKSHEDGSCSLFFEKEFHSRLNNQISIAYNDGKFANSNSEDDWNDLIAVIRKSEGVSQINMGELQPYIV
ncbi:MAG: hypothetical protein V4649_05560 [Bacteroidota bacterium]